MNTRTFSFSQMDIYQKQSYPIFQKMMKINVYLQFMMIQNNMEKNN